MDYNAINTFVDSAFFSANSPTPADVNHIIEFYKSTIFVPNEISIDASILRQITSKILQIKSDYNEIYELYELALAGLIIHRGKIDERTIFNDYYLQWIWSRYLLTLVRNNQPIEQIQKQRELLSNPSAILQLLKASSDDGLKALYEMRHLFVLIWNMNQDEIITKRSNFEKALLFLTTNQVWKTSALLLPIDSLPFFYTQAAMGLTYHNANNSTYFALLGQFYKILLELRHPNIPINLTLSPPRMNNNNRPLKLGFISRTLFNHSVCRIAMGLIEQLYQRPDIDIYIYSLNYNNPADNYANRIRAASTYYKIISPSDYTDAVTQIRNDNLDALIVLDPVLDIYSYCAAIYRLAPVQITTWGHPETSGSPNNDYYVTSAQFEKNIDNIYFEKPFLMNSLSFYYYDLMNTYNFDPIVMFKDTSRQQLCREIGLDVPEDAHIYGITATMFKIHPSFDWVLNAILHNDQKAYIVFIRGVNEELFQRVIQRLNQTIPGQYCNRIRIISYQTEPYSYEKFMLACDVLLDTFPFGGLISTYDAFSCNKCLITLPGNKAYGRFTQGLYKRMGFEDLIATTEENYVELAMKIATYPPLRRHFEKRIADNKHKLYQDEEAVNEWYNFLKNECNKEN
jgi:predicted O-linked N-acetylglucosamine transferase (SPINDLY family)